MLQLKNVKKLYNTKSGNVVALDDVSLNFPATGMVFITGKSGCGKTTLLNVIGGLDNINQGEISIFGKNFSTFSQSQYDDYRNTFIGFVFQEYNLLPEFTVEKNIKIAMELQGGNLDDKELHNLLETVEISNLKSRKPNELSGGQRQRVAIARALIKNPRIIMADEPTGALDSATATQVLDILKKLSKDKLVIVVSHDLEFAEKYADRVIKLVDGKVEDDYSFSQNEIQSNVAEDDNSFMVRNGANLSSKEKDDLAQAIKSRKKIEIIENLSFREKKRTEKKEPTFSEKTVEFQRSKMKLKSSFSLGVKSLGVKPVRLIFTILLSAIAFAVFGLFDTVANFSTAKVLNNIIRNSSYPSIVAYGQYILDADNQYAYDVKLNTQTINEIQSKSGFAIKGVYNFDDNTKGYTRQSYKITDISNYTSSVGTNYYTKEIDGILEFSNDEINDKFIRDFNYEIISGNYPVKRYNPINGEFIPESMYDIAISSYLAESIFFYLPDTNGDGIKEYKSAFVEDISQLINKTITINGTLFRIVGIIDCGSIPTKYDKLKTISANDAQSRMLVTDFNAYISSSAFKCIFAVDGFMEMLNNQQDKAILYTSGNSTWKITQSDVSGREADTFVYSVNDYDQDNILLFSNNYSQDGKVNLANDEVLIHAENLKILFYNRYYNELSNTDQAEAKKLISDISSNNTISIEEKRESLSLLLDLLYPTVSQKEKVINVSKTLVSSQNKITKDLKVVGVYFDIDNNRLITSTKYRFMMNDFLMTECGIYAEQGEYSKILIQANRSLRGTRYLAGLMTNETGLALNLFGNSTISLIKENQATIRHFANLFLYIALVLAVFSIFLLFNYITTSIVNKRQSIGILRGLGSGKKDILLIFIFESLIIALINAVLATALTAIGCCLVNLYINNVMNIAIPFAIFGTRQVFVIFGISIATALASSILPILKISKEKPVELIRKP